MKSGNTGKSKNISKSGKSKNISKSGKSKNILKSGNTGMSGNTGKSGKTYEISHLVDFWSCLVFQLINRKMFLWSKGTQVGT